MRFALQTGEIESYTILSRQSVPNDKPIEEIVLLPSISRALVFSDKQIHFYTLPSLDVVSHQVIKPIRNVVTFAVDQRHLTRPAPSANSASHRNEAVDFCVMKRTSIALYSLRERLFYQKEIPLPDGPVILARRIGSSLCLADSKLYHLLNLETAEMFPILPLNQDGQSPNLPVEPFIIPTGDNDFLVVSWTGENGSMGIFLTTSGDPVRGTLTWSQHPISICVDYPHVAALLPNGAVEIHNIDSQDLVQVIPPPPEDSPVDRTRLVSTLMGYLVPSTRSSAKMRKVPVSLNRGSSSQSES
ncbi:hypothetical protein BDP27DRAFT_1310251 [Rhodocollybia butyracea]|uniref:CNH domain-containing protein n=1 Tax=Rhodocollybia butyracea TaxID=206335 RepID=A0A9P5QAW0_9AGAR|nr:hypothetical protein BDP27DRAFT_1310251 [Rhodocollybia butyracea]